MGVYLSEPVTEKTTKVGGNRKDLSYVSCEMQGKPSIIKVGENLWRMLPSMKLILEMVTLFSLCLMVMEVI
jgi:hypothetical protein